MKRDSFDKVEKYLKKNKGASMKQAFKTTKVSAGTYYNQKQKLKRASLPAVVPTYEVDVLEPELSDVAFKPGTVALVGAPEDLARLLTSLTRGARI